MTENALDGIANRKSAVMLTVGSTLKTLFREITSCELKI